MAEEPVVEEPVVEEPVAEEPKVEPVVEPAKPSTAAEIAAAVAAAIKPDGSRLSPDQVEAEWQRVEAETGKTRQQIVAEDNSRREANLRDNLPLYEELGASRAEKVLKGDQEILAKVKERMSKLAPAVRANPSAWEDAAFLEKGKAAAEAPKKKDGEPGKVLGGKEKVNSGLSEGGGGGKPKPKSKEYPAFEQHCIDRQFGGDAEAYEKYKAKDSTKPREIAAGGENKADLAFKALTKGVKL